MSEDMQGKPAAYFLFFMLVSVLGWLYEVFLEVIVYQWGYSDRGVLSGPYCIIYGVGSLCLLLCLQGLRRRRICIGRLCITPILVFLSIVLLSTALELAASYIMEWTQGGWAWNYDRFWMNFQGRIAPNPSIRFGIGGMLVLYGIYPLFVRSIGRIGQRRLSLAAGCLAAVFLVDCALFAGKLFLT